MVEINVPGGAAYVQVTHEQEEFGYLIRALPGLHRSPPNLGRLVQQSHRWVAFYPVDEAIKRGLVRKIGSYPIPPTARDFPIFLAAGLPDRSGRVNDWWLWDGRDEKRIGALRDEQRDLPLREVINHEVLVTRLASGWSSRDDVARRLSQVPHDREGDPRPARHFLYFPTKTAAEAAADQARRHGFTVGLGERGDEWQLVAVSDILDIPEARSLLEDIASRSGGEYDGWEAAVTKPDASGSRARQH